jgi:hypothetical protein
MPTPANTSRSTTTATVVPCSPSAGEYARRNREYGVWGGETELDRALAGYGPTMPIGSISRAMRVATVYGGEER